MKRDSRVYIDDILEALQKIETYTAGLDFSAFAQDSKTIDATVRNFEIIGEAARKIPEETRNMYKQVPWKTMSGMRDKLIHEYFGVNIDVLWATIQEDLPPLKPVMNQVLKELNERQ